MNILLDTQVAIWALAAPERLSAASRDLIGDPLNDVFVSAISITEIAIKHRLGKRLGAPPATGCRRLAPTTARPWRRCRRCTPILSTGCLSPRRFTSPCAA